MESRKQKAKTKNQKLIQMITNDYIQMKPNFTQRDLNLEIKCSFCNKTTMWGYLHPWPKLSFHCRGKYSILFILLKRFLTKEIH